MLEAFPGVLYPLQILVERMTLSLSIETEPGIVPGRHGVKGACDAEDIFFE